MIKLILKQLCKNKKSNSWILIEILIVSVLLWYCVDFLYVIAYKNNEPLGINLENVYRLGLGANLTSTIDNNPDSIETLWVDPLLHIIKLIDEYPGVEATTYFVGSEPYNKNNIFQGYTANEKNAYRATIRYVGDDYDKVFKVSMQEGGFKDWGVRTSPQGAVISPQLSDSLFQSLSAIGSTFRDYYEPDLKFHVTGISTPMKYSVYERYEPFIYTPFNLNRLHYTIPKIAFRVSPQANTPLFEQQFVDDMKSKLNIGPFYFFSLSSYDNQAEVYEIATGISKYVSIIIGLIAFFLFIIFLGMLGTFWFQIESRNKEIGLRMALGSSRKGILNHIVSESIIIFSVAFILAFIICANLAYWNITYTYNDAMDYTLSRFWITIIMTGLIMLTTIIIGTLIPANRASKLHPVEALQDE